MLVFETGDEIFWFNNMRETHGAWKGYRGVAVHLGGMEVAGVWRWFGRIKDPLVVADWQRGQPDLSHQDCLAHWKDHRWHDVHCDDTMYLLTACEYSV
ncbi:hypothetical protein EB796_006857 [Bugula neritina]|nr:hypothetical protein EB796_019823 [Bugula neritina]KAF6034826.1 hypothetical protein EB796_006857 [Bugula neritina]